MTIDPATLRRAADAYESVMPGVNWKERCIAAAIEAAIGFRPISEAPLCDFLVEAPARCLVYSPRFGIQFGSAWTRPDGTSEAKAEGFQGEWGITHFAAEPNGPDTMTGGSGERTS